MRALFVIAVCGILPCCIAFVSVQPWGAKSRSWSNRMGNQMESSRLRCIGRLSHCIPRNRNAILQLRASGGEDWMFASVRGDETNRNAFDIGLIAPPFGDALVVGKRYDLQLSKSSDELLVKQAFAEQKEVAYGIGMASTSGTFANAQNYVAGNAVAKLKILSVREDTSGRGAGVSCSVAVVGRVLIKEVKHMRPKFVVSAFELEDATLRDELIAPTKDLRSEVEQKYSACLELTRKISDKRTQSRLSNLEKGSFLLNIPDDQLVELTRASKGGADGDQPAQAPPPEKPRTGTFDDALPLKEQLEDALSWMGDGDPKSVSPTRELEIFSFLALSGTGAGRDVIENALRSRDTRDRLCVSIELLDTELTRLRTEALLADFGG